MNIYEIAKLANTSPSTVSRVLNKSAKVNPQVEKRVLKVVEETNYNPSALAIGLSKRKTNLIGIVLPEINGFYTKYLKGINKRIRESGYNIIISTFNGGSTILEEAKKNFDILYSKRVDGIIYFPTEFNQEYEPFLKEISGKMPVVTVGRDTKLFSCIIQDDYGSAVEALEYIRSKGYTKIGFIKGASYLQSTSARYRAYMDFIEKNNLEHNEEWALKGDLSIASGYSAAKKLLDTGSHLPQVLLSANDNMAIGAIRAFLDSGLAIPKDIGVMGFDNVEIGKFSYPALSTVNEDQYSMGEKAGDLIIKLVEKKITQVTRVISKQEIIQRESL